MISVSWNQQIVWPKTSKYHGREVADTEAADRDAINNQPTHNMERSVVAVQQEKIARNNICGPKIEVRKYND